MDSRWKDALPVRTDRLTIRAITAADAAALFAIRQREDVADWISSHATDRKAFTDRVANDPGWQKNLAIELDGTVIGDLYLSVEDAWAQTEIAEQAKDTQAELGWTLSPDHQGKGYATEAVKALLRFCFTDLGLRRVTALCFADNTASWRLMERVGMRREAHTVADSLHRSGQWLDGLAYAILADEWRAQQQAPERFAPRR